MVLDGWVAPRPPRRRGALSFPLQGQGIGTTDERRPNMKVSLKAGMAAMGLASVLAISATPVEAARLYFGTQEHLGKIQDVDVKGPKGEALYLGFKYSFHSFLLPYSVTDDGYVLGVRGEKAFFRLDQANIKSLQARRLLPSPLPPYQLSTLDYAMGHSLWGVGIVIVGMMPLSMLARRRRKRAQPHLANGIAYHQAGDLYRAIESYSQALDIDPKFAAALHLRGKAFAGMQDIRRGISDQTKAIRLQPKFVEALMDRGIALHTTGNYDGAISDFSRVIKLTKDANALFLRGQSYLGKSDLRKAVADFTKVIKLAPGVAEAYQQRALAYAKMGDAERAQADYDRACAMLDVQPAR